MAKKENENGLKPHYAPNVKPYKKGIEVYPHTDFRRMEIYPHTEYHRQEPFWLYREVGLLKNWLMSLTKLYNLLAMQETEDVTDLTQEIKDLIDKLAILLNSIQTDLEALVIADKKYKANISSMLGKINSLTNDITNLIINLNPLFSDLFNCIENRLFVFDNDINIIFGDITEINNQIQNIWEALEDILKGSSSTSTLTLGTDYTMSYYNGWYCKNADSPIVSRSRTALTMKNSIFYTDTISVICSTNCYFTNDAVLTSSSNENNFPTFAHANARADVPLSWLYAIHFLNSNYSRAISTSQDSSDAILDFIYGEWNTSARATWAVETSFDRIDDGTFRNSLVNIEDGYNSQYYYDYPTNLGLTFGNFNNRMELLFQYSE